MNSNDKKQSRKLRRFFTTQSLSANTETLLLDEAETKHVQESIRLKEGDACFVTDGKGAEVEAVILSFLPDGKTKLHITRLIVKTGEFRDRVKLRMFPTMLRKGKTDLLVEKSQELGVFEFSPIVSEHCEVQIAREKTEKVVERWNRIACEASKQSGCLNLVKINGPQSFKDVLAAIGEDEAVVIFHPAKDAIPFSGWIKIFESNKASFEKLNIFIGPEGGFSEDEIKWARWHRREKNFWIVKLGEVLFKADTAFVGVAAALRFYGVLESK